ncbi:MauE/DoxX family redox-associated membrane protein [Chitinophaga sp. HK235]|uniref:MauE/DoxX family redox-associated membrane protein n=1 Tax=Chitinophaga sp. HK235 TaxID=2952571 RepID=UPI001BA4CA97|nr:MauE/DoxX family redox-associated membrane protein [Chitinophaga sp. HK235]
MKKELFTDLAIIIYAVLLSYTASSKLMDISLFAHDMGKQPFSKTLVPIITWAVPIVELVILLLLIIPRFRITGLKAATGLMLVFTIYAILILLRVFPEVPCSCGGVIRSLTWKQHLVFNVSFLILGIAGLVSYPNKPLLKFR